MDDDPRRQRSHRLHLPHYLPFAFFGAAQVGIAGLIIPRLAGTAALAGVAWATFSLGAGVASIVWGRLTLRLGRAVILRAGLVLGIAGMLGLAVARGPTIPIAAALLGAGGAGVQMTTILFIRLWYPHPQWDKEIGIVETWMGIGQVGGMLLVAATGSAHSSALLASLLSGVALLIVLPFRDPGDRRPRPRIAREHVSMQRLEQVALAPAYHLGALRRADLRILFTTPLPLLLGRWGLLMLASIPVAAFAPLLLHDTFALSGQTVSVGLAVVAAIGVAWYRPASGASHRFGATRVVYGGAFVRAAGILILALGTWLHGPGWAAFASYALFAMAWPPLSIASTIRVSDLAPPEHAGTALGLYNAIASGARVIGSAAAGLLVSRLGYAGLLAICGVIVLLTMCIPPARAAGGAVRGRAYDAARTGR